MYFNIYLKLNDETVEYSLKSKDKSCEEAEQPENKKKKSMWL